MRAPIAGTVIARKATVGMAVSVAATRSSRSAIHPPLWIIADVFERDPASQVTRAPPSRGAARWQRLQDA